MAWQGRTDRAGSTTFAANAPPATRASSGGWGRSAGLLRALSHAGLPHGQFGFGGEHFGKRFELAEDDELRVLVNHDRDLMRAVADGHAVRK